MDECDIRLVCNARSLANLGNESLDTQAAKQFIMAQSPTMKDFVLREMQSGVRRKLQEEYPWRERDPAL